MIVGRKHEQQILEECLYTGRNEFLAVYGRIRVGKTYHIKEYLKSFSFYATVVIGAPMKTQLTAFQQALKEYGNPDSKPRMDCKV